MNVLAVQPKTDRLKIQMIPSPLQSPVLNYKSSYLELLAGASKIYL